MIPRFGRELSTYVAVAAKPACFPLALDFIESKIPSLDMSLEARLGVTVWRARHYPFG
jgi:hypothetical protein